METNLPHDDEPLGEPDQAESAQQNVLSSSHRPVIGAFNIESQQQLLLTYRATLTHLLMQVARYGPSLLSPHIAHDVDNSRTAIRKLKTELRERGVAVADEFGEEPLAEGKELNALVDGQKRVCFIYVEGDCVQARQLYRQLRADGFAPWLDAEDILPGHDRLREVGRAINEADAVLICLSGRRLTPSDPSQEMITRALHLAERRS